MNQSVFFSQLSKAFTRFIPLIVFYSLLIVLNSMFQSPVPFLTSVTHFTEILIVPVLTTLIGYYTVGKKTIMPSLLIGTYAGIMETSFLGGLLAALLIINVFKVLEKVYNYDSPTHRIIKLILITVVSLTIFHYVILPPIEIILTSTTRLLEKIQEGNLILLVALLGGLTAFDMGGPFNKLSFAFSLSAYLEGQYHISGPALIAAGIAPLAISLSIIVLPRFFSSEERNTKYRTMVLGLVGITEGALPYASRRPLFIIPQVTIGSMIGSIMAAHLGLSNSVYIASVPGVIGVNNIIIFISSILVGVIASSLLIILSLFINRQLSSTSE